MPLCVSPASCSLIGTCPSPCLHHIYALVLIGLLLLPTTGHCPSMSQVHPPPCCPSIYMLLLACSLQPRCIHRLRQIYWLGHIWRPRHALTDEDTFTPADQDMIRGHHPEALAWFYGCSQSHFTCLEIGLTGTVSI